MKKYMIILSIITVAVALFILLIIGKVMPIEPAYTWWLLPAAFFFISATGHSLLMRSFRGQDEQFMTWFLLATTVKLLLYLALLLVWFLISGHQLSTSFIIAFASLYVSVTALDLSILASFRKKQR
jgi:hypothetical protein